MTESQATGIDVSHFQGTVNWTEVAASGIVFAFAKATDGITYLDPQFSVNWPAMKNAGLVRGAYHFYEPADDPASQAQHFLSNVTLETGDLPPVLDVEITGGVSSEELWSGVATWLQTVQTAIGRQPLLYTAPGFWNDNSPSLALTTYPLWLADYASQPTLPNGWSTWHFWQHSQTGTVPGVSTSVDLDLFNGTLLQLQEWLAPAMTPTTTTVSATAKTTTATHRLLRPNRQS
ncbi:MAG TPA: GH25 family lysozyme [Thermoanaerobaculia bacterium]|jgi:lysozyme|nr:GH25 family lysozyme [Thermoanaerobaculia bacterium]